MDMLTPAREQIDVLVYAAVFLHEAYPRLNELLKERAAGPLTSAGDGNGCIGHSGDVMKAFAYEISSRCHGDRAVPGSLHDRASGLRRPTGAWERPAAAAVDSVIWRIVVSLPSRT
ncbi:hypothetical protein ACIA8I_06200 [Streptomyces rishiriensis]|uniref:hypothetical protein n=1 Tax=Streptomyces rishiriensis TaxID=68264 RepID=UPI0037927724